MKHGSTWMHRVRPPSGFRPKPELMQARRSPSVCDFNFYFAEIPRSREAANQQER
jgi:hypothetical protein